MSIELVMSSNHLILSHPLLLLPSTFLASGSFPMSQLFASDGQNIGASASVLPMNIQGWFPLGLTGLISFLSKGLSKVFSSTTVRKHQFLGTQPSLRSNSHVCTWLLENQLWLHRVRYLTQQKEPHTFAFLQKGQYMTERWSSVPTTPNSQTLANSLVWQRISLRSCSSSCSWPLRLS